MLLLADLAARRVESMAASATDAHLDAVQAGAEVAAARAWSRVEAGVERLAADAEIGLSPGRPGAGDARQRGRFRIDAAALAPQRHRPGGTSTLAARAARRPTAAARRRRRPAGVASRAMAQAQYVAGAGLVADGAYAAAHAAGTLGCRPRTAEHGFSDLLLVRAGDGLVV
ncbi:MAG: hypothetical protein U0802_07835 [Candidatus Binatia bacterium]